jgi:hypothetical protein
MPRLYTPGHNERGFDGSRSVGDLQPSRLEEVVRVAALQRLELETYGKCRRCRERIRDARVKVVPD